MPVLRIASADFSHTLQPQCWCWAVAQLAGTGQNPAFTFGWGSGVLTIKGTAVAALMATLLVAFVPVRAHSAEQFVSVLSYRAGPYGNNGASVFGGFIDYMRLINLRGGVNGVKLAWEECETEYNNARGLDCYERLKHRSASGGTMVHPVSTGIASALLEKTAADKVPMVMIGYGRTDAVDGRYFPYAFPLVATYQMQASAMLAFIAGRESDRGKAGLQGKKIAFVHHDSLFGKEPLHVLQSEARLRRFQLIEIPVAHPGINQREQWRQVVDAKSDYVIFWGWGAMNPAGLQEAQKAGFPSDRIVGVWWASAEEDARAAGPGAKGYMAANFGITGRDLPVMQDILNSLYASGLGNMKDESRIGSVLYSRGVLHGIVTVEAIRQAQAKFGHRVVTGEEVQWALERFSLNQSRLRELGAEGMMPDLNVTCRDHEGSGKVMFQQWDGNRWNRVSDYIEGNRKLVRRLLEASARKYGRDQKIKPRRCAEGTAPGAAAGRSAARQ